MESLGLYEPGELSLFGGEQLLMELSSPLEHDFMPTFPDVHEKAIGDLLGTELPELKAVDITSNQCHVSTKKHEDASCLDLSWLDTKLDLYDLIGESTPQETPTFTPDIVIPSGLTTGDDGFTEPTITAESLFGQIAQGTSGSSTDGTVIENDLLTEVLGKLSHDVIQITETDNYEVANITEGLLSPVSVDDIESLLSGPVSPSDIGPMDSGLESLLSSTAASPISSPVQMQSMQEFADDPDFEPEVGPIKSSKSKRSSKPYKKMPVDRKERKKVQNKTAALKYRIKKKIESEGSQEECDRLETRNKELKDKVESMTKEIQYLKDLMAEVMKAKGVQV